MKLLPENGKVKHWYDGGCRCSLRHFLFLFIFLLVLVLINLLASTSKLRLVLDVSMKMKSDMIDVINNFVDLNQAESINGTFRIQSVHGDGLGSRDSNLRTRLEVSQNGRTVHGVIGIDAKEESNLRTYKPNWYFQPHPNNNSDTFLHASQDLGHDVQPQEGIRRFRSMAKQYVFPIRKQGESGDIVRKLDNADIKEVQVDKNAESAESWRKDSCDTCFQHNFNYVIDNPDVCKLTSPTETIDLLILILTVHKNKLARSIMRNSWLSPSRNNTGNIRHVFLLGETPDSELRNRVLEEGDRHGDIIMEDFLDTYMNLTYKSVMGFKWAATKCGHARFVLKTDDDMYVNTKNLLEVVNKHSSALQTAIGGACNQNAQPIRNENSKWYASFSSYPYSHYPGFCSGTGYVTSMAVVQKIYEISPSVPFFHLEDVYVALCIRKLGFSLKSITGFNVGRPRLDPCTYKGPKLVTAHHMSPLMLQMVWRRNCPLQYGNRTRSLVKRGAQH